MRVASPAHQVADGDAVRGGGVLREQPQDAGQFAGGAGVDVPAVQGHDAGGGLQQPGQAAQQRGLAAGVGADDHGHPALGEPDGEPVHDARWW